MKLSRKEILRYSNDVLRVEEIQDYCPNGLQVEGKEEIGKLAVAVSASMAVIEQACSSGCDALLVHHGLFWKGDDYSVTGVKKKKLEMLLEHEVSLFAYHLPLDVHEVYGNNWVAAQKLGWSNIQPFGKSGNLALGVKGEVAPLSAESMRGQLEEYFHHPAHYAPGEGQIQTVAFISGGAHKYISEAAAEGIDCFISGSFDEPVWHIAKEEGVHFFALGHAATEENGVKAFAAHLSERFGIENEFIAEKNPF